MAKTTDGPQNTHSTYQGIMIIGHHVDLVSEENKMAHDVFISYSTKDKPIADAICANLEVTSIRCWIAPRDIAPGEDWPAAITQAISQSHIMVLVFSAYSNSSEDVSRELMLAAKNKLVIIPFKIENIEPEPGKEYYLARTHWLDAINPPTQEQIQELVNCVKALVPLRDPTFNGNQTVTVAPPGMSVQVDQAKKPENVPPLRSTTKPVSKKSRASRWLWLIPIGVVLFGSLGWAAFNLLLNHPASPVQPTPFLITTPYLTAITIPTTKPAPVAEVLYSDDFADNQSGWRQEDAGGGVVQYSGEQYVIGLEKGIGMGWSCANHYFSDAVLTVDATLVSGDAKLTGPAVIWRFVDYQNFYALRLSGNGDWYIQKLLNGEWQDIDDWRSSSAFDREQQIIKVAITFDGETSTIYINDKFMTSFQDPSFTYGDICLAAVSHESSAVEVSFDNLVVYTINGWTPPK